MADILPISLPDILENVETTVTFTSVMGEGETLISINIIDSRPNVGITISGPTYSGYYMDSFQIGSNSIKIRNRKSGLIETFGSWEELPPPQDADLFEFNSPSVLKTDYTYTVKMLYNYTPPIPPNGIALKSTQQELIKTYTQTVHGNWSVWQKKLRDYVSASGPFPK